MAPKGDAIPELALPNMVFGLVELRRMRRELEALDDFMRQSALREAGKQPALPRTSRLLETLAADNQRNLLQSADRAAIQTFLTKVEASAPVLHFSFAADPSAAFLAKLVVWLRANIHPTALINLGLQPAIAAGCIMRTSRRSYDFSLRQHLLEQAPALAAALTAQPAQTPQPAVVPSEVPA